jgi:hypothetical protein
VSSGVAYASDEATGASSTAVTVIETVVVAEVSRPSDAR